MRRKALWGTVLVLEKHHVSTIRLPFVKAPKFFLSKVSKYVSLNSTFKNVVSLKTQFCDATKGARLMQKILAPPSLFDTIKNH